jgi:hypothetical protein
MIKVLAIAVMATGLLGPCSESGSSSGDDTHDNDSSTGSEGGGSGNYTQYDTLTGTFVAPGINVKFSGAMQGTYMNPDGEYITTWNAAGAALQFVGGIPPAPKVTGTFPAGDTATIVINVADIVASPAARTFTCAGGDYQVTVGFYLHSASSVLVQDYEANTCTLTFSDVKNAGDSEYPSVYFAHGSLTATLGQGVPAGSTNTGTMSATW